MGFEASTTGFCCKMDGSKIIWVIQFWDLVLNKLCSKCESNWISHKSLRFSGKELSLSIGLLTIELLDLGLFLKMCSGLSTIAGGFGSGWDLVQILLEART